MRSEPIPNNNTYRAHIRATLALGIPLVGSQLGLILMNTTDTIMLGWYGVTELAATVLASQLYFVVMIFGAGFAQGVMSLASSAAGEDDERTVRRTVRMGFWVSIAYSTLVLPILWNAEAIFRMLEQDEQVAKLGGEYMRIAMWAIYPALLGHSLRAFLSVIERAQIIFTATMIGVLVNIALNYALIFGNFGAPELGVRGAALATLIVHFLMFVFMALYAARQQDAARYDLFARFWRSDWQSFWQVVRIGFPISVTILAEVGLFIFTSIMMGWLGIIALAAHGIALQIASIAFMIPMGLSQVATVRVGRALGKNDAIGLNRAAITVMALALGIAIIGAIIMIVVPEPLIRLFLDPAKAEAGEVLLYALPLLVVAAAFQLADSAQAVGLGLLRGLQDTKIPMVLAIFSYWIVGLPLAWWLGFRTGMEGTGIWLGLAIGLSIAAILLNGRFVAERRTATHNA